MVEKVDYVGCGIWNRTRFTRSGGSGLPKGRTCSVADDRPPMAVDFASGARVHVPFLGVAKAKEVPDALSERRLAIMSAMNRRLARSVAASDWFA